MGLLARLVEAVFETGEIALHQRVGDGLATEVGLEVAFGDVGLSRYTHRVAISNSRLIALDDNKVTFKYKDYRAKDGDRQQTMALPIAEFIRRFLSHVLPSGFHRIRHYGLFANGGRTENLARARHLLAMPTPDSELGDGQTADPDKPPISPLACSCCGGRMIVIETFEPGHPPRAPPPSKADRP
jgi:hypothetical protein